MSTAEKDIHKEHIRRMMPYLGIVKHTYPEEIIRMRQIADRPLTVEEKAHLSHMERIVEAWEVSYKVVYGRGATSFREVYGFSSLKVWGDETAYTRAQKKARLLLTVGGQHGLQH